MRSPLFVFPTRPFLQPLVRHEERLSFRVGLLSGVQSYNTPLGNPCLGWSDLRQARYKKGISIMEMISYWKDTVPFYEEDGEMTLIYGYYDHKNEQGGVCEKNKCIGIYWRNDYPSARGRLAPCVIPDVTAKCLLMGLLFEFVSSGKMDKASNVLDAIRFLKGEKGKA